MGATLKVRGMAMAQWEYEYKATRKKVTEPRRHQKTKTGWKEVMGKAICKEIMYTGTDYRNGVFLFPLLSSP